MKVKILRNTYIDIIPHSLIFKKITGKKVKGE